MRDVLDIGGMMFICAAIGMFLSIILIALNVTIIAQAVITSGLVIAALIMFIWSLAPKKKKQ